jgi:hypothetical protein
MAVIPQEAAGRFERIDRGLADVFALRRSLILSRSDGRASAGHIAAAGIPSATEFYDQSGMASPPPARDDPPPCGASRAADTLIHQGQSANPLHSGAR